MSAKLSPFFFFCLFTTLFFGIFYFTVTFSAGLYIVSDLGGGTHISVYAMAFFGLGNVLSIPVTTPLSDRLGPIKLLVYALLVYTLFSWLCCVAPTFFIFNCFRLGMGIASGVFYILCRRLVLRFAPSERVPTYTFIMLLLYAITPVLGASLGAWLAYENLWRWIFHIHEPISLLLAAYFWLFYRQTDPKPTFPTFDTVGYIFYLLGTASLVTAAVMGQELDWFRSPIFSTLCLIGIPCFFFFILWEVNSPHPLLELRLLRSPLLSYSLINLATLFSTYFGMIILITLWLNIYVNYTPLWIALLIITMGIAGVLAYMISRSLLIHFDPRVTLALAIICFALSCYYSTYFDAEVDFFHLAVARFLAGLGLVFFLLPLFQLAFASYEAEKSHAIFALFQVVRALSSSLGASLYVILWQRRQVFFYERLGESLTINSQHTIDYFHKATTLFKLTKAQAISQLEVLLERQSTSLALNDVFGCMGYILVALLGLLVLSFYKGIVKHPRIEKVQK